jgi:hypothetical protein
MCTGYVSKNKRQKCFFRGQKAKMYNVDRRRPMNWLGSALYHSGPRTPRPSPTISSLLLATPTASPATLELELSAAPPRPESARTAWSSAPEQMKIREKIKARLASFSRSLFLTSRIKSEHSGRAKPAGRNCTLLWRCLWNVATAVARQAVAACRTPHEWFNLDNIKL